MTALNFATIFDNYVAANQKTFAHDRSKTLGGSEVYGCLRKAWFGKRGAEFGFVKDADASDDWGATQRGDILENHFVVPAVSGHLPDGASLLFAGTQQKTLVSGRNSATPDGLIVGLEADALSLYGVEDIGSDCIVMEIKTIDPRVSLSEEKQIHHGQAQTQMGLIRETTKWQPNFAVILYVNASFLDDIKVFVVPFDPTMWTTAKRRAETIWAYDDPSEIRPEGKFDGSCKHCPFTEACAVVQTGKVPEKRKTYRYGPEHVEEMEIAIASYREAKEAKETAEREFEMAKEDVKRVMREADTRTMKPMDDSKRWSVSYYSQGGNTTYDVKRMREDGIDLSPYEKPGAPFEVVRITFDA